MILSRHEINAGQKVLVVDRSDQLLIESYLLNIVGCISSPLDIVARYCTFVKYFGIGFAISAKA